MKEVLLICLLSAIIVGFFGNEKSKNVKSFQCPESNTTIDRIIKTEDDGVEYMVICTDDNMKEYAHFVK